MSLLWLMRFVELVGVYIILKGCYELYANYRHSKDGGGVYGSHLHSKQHMAVLIGIITYNIYDIWSYVYFEDYFEYSKADYSVLFFNLLFLNLLWLILIDHFKQERLSSTKPSSFTDLFKF